MYRIDKDIPPPARVQTYPQRLKYPVKFLKVGESFFIPCEKLTPRQLSNRVTTSVLRQAKRHFMKIASQERPDGIRIWRID